jgi:hypothetical protein
VVPFYAALAASTREFVLSQANVEQSLHQVGHEVQDATAVHASGEEGDLWLGDLLAYLLVPARCGVFLSRGRFGQIARELGVRLPFGPRHEVARSLFNAAGDGGKLQLLLNKLEAEVGVWGRAYSEWGAAHPAWRVCGEMWNERVATTLALLGRLHLQAASLAESKT